LDSPQNYQPLTPAEKFGKREPIFRPGAAGFGKYFGAAYVDLVIGNYMTEAVFPTLLRQDLRGYFRRGTGSGWSRLRYALGQTLWTHHDSSTLQFNHSEIVGSVAAGVCRCQARRSSLHRYSRKYPQRVLAGSGANARSSQKTRFAKTRSQKLTNVVIGPTAASGGQLSENTYDWFFGLLETQVP
jgi:hypothetical protein